MLFIFLNNTKSIGYEAIQESWLTNVLQLPEETWEVIKEPAAV